MRKPLAGCVLLASACSGSAVLPREPTIELIDGVRTVTNHEPAWPAGKEWRISHTPLLEIGVDEGAAGEMLTRPRGVAALPSSETLVADGSKQLRVFDDRGRFIRAFGRPGDGPCEFNEIGVPYVADDGSVAVPDWRTRKVAVFDSAGDCLVEHSLQHAGEGMTDLAGRLGGGDLVLTNAQWAWGTPRAEISWVEADILSIAPGSPDVTHLSRVRQLEWNGAFENLKGASFGSAVARGANVYFTDGEDYTITRYDTTGRLEVRMRLVIQPEPITDDDIATYRRAALSWHERRRSPRPPVEIVDSWHYASSYPAYRTILIDELGHVWAARQGGFDEWIWHFRDELPDLELAASNTWDIYAPDGVWLGSLLLSYDRSPRLVRGNRVYFIGESEAGEARIFVHELSRPS